MAPGGSLPRQHRLAERGARDSVKASQRSSAYGKIKSTKLFPKSNFKLKVVENFYAFDVVLK